MAVMVYPRRRLGDLDARRRNGGCNGFAEETRLERDQVVNLRKLRVTSARVQVAQRLAHERGSAALKFRIDEKARGSAS